MMRASLPTGSIALFSLAVMALGACVDSEMGDASAIPEITAREITLTTPDVVILDVRTAAEFAAGHVPGAINIDVQAKGFDNLVAELDRSKTYVVHCAANVESGRSTKALATMDDLGFDHLQSLQGGFVAWAESGSPVSTTP
ncbi:MAG: rhodanese-like domain-containing protein [Pseudomonadota bacterium]